MRNSSTFRDSPIRSSWLFKCFTSRTCCRALGLPGPCDRSESNHVAIFARSIGVAREDLPADLSRRWRKRRDGYLWIGTEKGLIRFDGLSFRPFQQASPSTFTIGPVQGLIADARGNLWILLQSTKILRYHDGKFEPGGDEAEVGITSSANGETVRFFFRRWHLVRLPTAMENLKF